MSRDGWRYALKAIRPTEFRLSQCVHRLLVWARIVGPAAGVEAWRPGLVANCACPLWCFARPEGTGGKTGRGGHHRAQRAQSLWRRLAPVVQPGAPVRLTQA